MNDYEQELIDELLEAEQEYDIDSRVIQDFKRESKQKKIDKNKKLNKKIKNVKIDLDEKE